MGAVQIGGDGAAGEGEDQGDGERGGEGHRVD
jgi:hypothetical protein